MGFEQITENIKLMPLKKKIILVFVIFLTITSLVLLFAWMQKPNFQVLYSNLSEEDAGAIIQKLKEQKIQYKTSSGSIMVPADRVYELRLQMASQGLPHGGSVGFELFDKSNFTMTDFVQKLNYRRALQGELARTISSLTEIEQCRVHLAVPEKTLFTKEDEKPKASVMVKLRPGRKLSNSQIQGIVHLVSSSVEGLNYKDVSIIDQSGEMLTQENNSVLALTKDQLEYQRRYEKDLENSIISILDPVVGKGKVKAKVNATLDFTKVEKTEERFDPDSQVVRSEQKNIEKSFTGSTGGVPGVASNLPNKQTTQLSSNHGQSEKKNETVNYEISKITSHIINIPGEVKRVTAAVLVDGIYTAQQGSNEKKYTPRSEEELKQLEEMVKKAIGFNQERGDEVKVVNMQFETVPQEELPPVKTEIMPIVVNISKYLAPVIALIILALFVIRPLLKSLAVTSATQKTLPGVNISLPQTVNEIEKRMELSQKPLGENVIEWAKKNPKEASNLIKNWIEEG